MSETVDQVDKIYRTTAKKEYSLTDKQLDTLQCEEVVNPRYKSGSKARLYRRADVERLAASITKEEKEAKAKRSASARQAAEKRKDELIRAVESLPITVHKLSKGEVKRRAIDNYNSAERRNRGGLYASLTSDENFLERIAVNYVRHSLTPYERVMDDISGKPGFHEAYIVLKERILEKIAEAYPFLEPECSRQQVALDDQQYVT